MTRTTPAVALGVLVVLTTGGLAACAAIASLDSDWGPGLDAGKGRDVAASDGFGGDAPADAADATAVDGAMPDAGGADGGADSAADARPDAPPRPFCEGKDAAVFCDDFTRPDA